MHTRCVCWLSRSTRCDPSLWIGVSVAARRHGLGPSFAALSLHRWRLNCRLCRPLLHPCDSGPHPPSPPCFGTGEVNTAVVFEVGEAADYSQPAHESEAMRAKTSSTRKVFIHRQSFLTHRAERYVPSFSHICAVAGPSRPGRPPRGRPFVVHPDLAADRAEAACRFDRAPLTTTICAYNVFRACAAFVVSATSSITAPSHSLHPAAEASRATNAISSTLSQYR